MTGSLILQWRERRHPKETGAGSSVNEVLKTLGCSRDRAVYIGDSDVDIQTAANAQMDHIIVEWGFRDVPFLTRRREGAGGKAGRDSGDRGRPYLIKDMDRIKRAW